MRLVTGWMLRTVTVSTLALAWLTFTPAKALAFSSLNVFGDSLSDSGNNAIALALNVTPTPIPGNSFIPTFP